MNDHTPVRGLRHAFRTEVEIGWGAEVLKCVTRDIGDMGMFIETDHPLWLRAEFTARLKLGEVLEIDCIVRRVEPGRGMAVEFKDLPEAEREQIDLFLGKLSRK
jgi:PilZ domain